MNKNDSLLRHKNLLRSLNSIPKQIIALHSSDSDNVPAFVLHGLCCNDCFGLSKAAYFVDNPDFNFVKGIAGYSQDESYSNGGTLWESPQSFTDFTKNSKFNSKVKSFDNNSVKRNNNSYDVIVKQICEEIGFKNPDYCSWDMKHYNHGLLVYEKGNDTQSDLFDEHFADSLHLLSFCPIPVTS